METAIFAVLLTFAFMGGGFVFIFIFCYLLNPTFWQGYRNSKFIDQLKKEEFDEMSALVEA